MRKGARGLSEVRTPCSSKEDTVRRAFRSPVSNNAGTSLRGSSPRKRIASQDFAGPWRQGAGARFLLYPNQNSIAQSFGLDELLHELDLIEASFEEEANESRQGFLRQCAATISIVAPWQVGFHQAGFVGRHTARESSCH